MSNEHADQILESMLEETLGGKSPPDLSDRILAAWQREKVTGERQESVTVAGSASVAPAGKRPIVAELVRPAEPVHLEPKSEPTRHRAAVAGGSWRVLLATSAAIAVLLTGWALKDQFFGAEQTQRANAKPDDVTTAESENVADSLTTDSAPTLAADAPVPKDKSNDSLGQTLPLDDLPFAPTPRDLPQIDRVASNAEVAPVLTNQEVVAAVNERLNEIWRQSGVTPTPPLAQTDWLRKASQRLIANDELATSIATDSREAAVAEYVSSTQFAKQWAVKLTKSWLAQTPGAANKNTVAAIEEAVEKRLADGAGFSSIAVDLLGGDLAAEGPTQAFVGSLAGGGNHNLLRRIGSHFMGTNLGCVQCHDRGTSTPADLAAPLDQQVGYWSLIAMLRGIDIKIDSSGRRVPVDNQDQIFGRGEQHNEFFELPDGRIKAAIARLPNGTLWAGGDEMPRVALARWIAQSQEFDMSVANQVWSFVSGDALVHDASYPDLAALQSRSELLSFLAQQYRANGRSVQKLASWIVSSEAFDRQPLNLTVDQLVLASEAELEQVKLTQRLFASGLPAESPPGLERSLMLAADFRRPTTGKEVTLAQPTATIAPSGRAKDKSQKEPGPEQLAFTLGADHVSFANASFVDSLLQSKRLTWDQRVRHVVLLNSHARVTGRVQQLANTLLQHHNGDSRAALIDLLWAVERSL